MCPCVSWSLLVVQASAVIHWSHRAGRGEDGVTRARGRVEGVGFWQIDISISPISLLSPPETLAQTSSMQTLFPLHPNRALWASYNFNDLDTPGSQWGHNPDSAWDPHNAPTSRCDCRAPSVTGEGIISLFSYLRGRTVLKPSQTDG